ncbi:MAG TPA: cobyrinate a,c-diamide synthase [Desulfobulbaceae bacterium]|nr:cobyrinate a,c-diamide synthase [Desulfobulbaceae bacterium]
MAGNFPAVIVAGTHSGCGKTTLTLGIMAALRERGVAVQPFKCGPDFIDPTLHRCVTGRVSRNLDVRMCGADFVRQTFAAHAPAAGISVIEGVMGLFDGGHGSAAHLAELLDVPVILVVDVRSAAESVAAVVKGFETLDRTIRVGGVIFNRVGSSRHLQMITDAVTNHCRAKIIGALPRDRGISLPSRHLGLHMGPEMDLDQERLAALVKEHCDLDGLLQLASTSKFTPPGPEPATSNPQTAPLVRLGIARDAAFCFYYQDNLDLLRRAGAGIVVFSPLHDDTLPEDLDGLYLGGGYPELHASRLADNASMREDIRRFSRSSRPVYAECGGFMYLCESIVDTLGMEHPMAGVYPVRATMGKRLRRLGYRQTTMRAPTSLGRKGDVCYGHEFHYSEIDPMPDHVERAFLLEDGRGEGYNINNTLAGYVHLHWGRTPDAARRFVAAMALKSHGNRA